MIPEGDGDNAHEYNLKRKRGERTDKNRGKQFYRLRHDTAHYNPKTQGYS